jgi:SAM-dependent methyltransferase
VTNDGERHVTHAPSAWVRRWSHCVPAGARVLDVACGSGRHVRWFAQRGARVTGVDRDDAAFAALRALQVGAGAAVELLQADLEAGPWPWPGRRFDAIVVTNYLWRPLLPTLAASVDEGGVLVCETYARGNETVGRPSNPDFLLMPGELLAVAAAAGLRTVAFEDGFLEGPPRFVQRIVAVREPAAGPVPEPPARDATLNSPAREDPA